MKRLSTLLFYAAGCVFGLTIYLAAIADACLSASGLPEPLIKDGPFAHAVVMTLAIHALVCLSLCVIGVIAKAAEAWSDFAAERKNAL